MDAMRIKFSKANDQAKLKRIEVWMGRHVEVYSVSLPSGHSCPFARDCLSKAHRITGKITDGKHTEFRCFAASDEARSPNARTQRWHNFDVLRKLDFEEMVDVIYESVPADADIIRVHVGGDFFNERYFRAWMHVASLIPSTLFYAYTKSIPYWVANLDAVPENFILTGSRGGRADALLDEYSLKVAEVVFSLEEAEEKGLEIDHDESHAIVGSKSYALLIHGTQPKGTKANQSMRDNKAKGVEFSYSR